MDLHTFLRTRRSVRRFKPDPVPASVVERILETSIHAPSAHNLQPWRFAIIRADSYKSALGKALTEKMCTDMTAKGASNEEIEKRVKVSLQRIDEAPVVILLCRDTNAIRTEEPEEHIMGIQSVALAGLQVMLAAHAEDLGSNWICWPLYAQEETRSALNLPDNWQPQGMFFIGHADETHKEKILKSVDEVTITL
ncbi:MAG: nitroreductase family protein [Anaerolineales bacterium]